MTDIKVFPLGFGSPANAFITEPRIQIQSLLFRGQNLIVGTRSGGITYLSLDIPEELKNKDPDIRDHIYPVYEPTDHEVPCEVCFDRSGNRIYSLSLRGELAIWKLQPLELKFRQVIGEHSVRLIALRTVDFVFCVFHKEVVGLMVEQNSSSVEKITGLSRPFIREISDARVNIEDNLIAIAFLEDSDEFPSIRIFKIDWDKGLDFLCSIEDLTSQIEIMDFTTDDTYLMFKEVQGQKVFFDLQTQKKIDTLGQVFDPEFLSTGLHLSESVQLLSQYESPDMTFQVMVRVGNSSVLVGDSLGALQVFGFPIQDFPGNKLYTEHLSEIKSISLTLDRRKAVTTSTYDR